ncbi:hypothetical protein EMCG_02200 [[Emmonsia] crescens]|uniref:Uncharacterized protein n=1 Tax=[Emmonsia] crescens TaxID=73230 RepID=A0A0G2J1S0_9EURO|nr:hypothetical protein EMCG_02200 [Emmonsia crescens UAMH 3008]
MLFDEVEVEVEDGAGDSRSGAGGIYFTPVCETWGDGYAGAGEQDGFSVPANLGASEEWRGGAETKDEMASIAPEREPAEGGKQLV